MELAEGMVFAGYTIERELGSGSSGTVYLAHHPRLPRKDALKILADGSGMIEDLPRKFLREADLAARLHHPNLVAVRDRGFEHGRLWLAMQYVDGPDLAELIRRAGGGLDPARAVTIISEAAQGIDEIHAAGLLHRDVKPANILVAESVDGADRVVVTDFGIALALADLAGETAPETAAGTLAYAAPEQIRAERIDHRVDVYALGCTLFHALTGSVPFPRSSTAGVMYAHLHDEPPRPSERKPGVAAEFDAVVAKAMAKDPAERYESCAELAAAARSALAAPVGRPAGERNSRSRRLVITAGALVVLVTAAVGGVLALGAGDFGDAVAERGVNAPISGSAEAREWGALGYLATAFPDLLPPTPSGAGYQELSTCTPTTSDGGYQPVSLDAELPIHNLFCVGNLDPVWTVAIACNADRTPILPDELLASVEGHEAWTRAGGSGNLFWGKDFYPDNGSIMGGKVISVLDVYFDDSARNFCRVRAFGDVATGAELRTRWWREAPL